MKYTLFSILLLGCCACCPVVTDALKPNHLGITSAYEMEIQHGVNVKHKPKIQTSLDWNF